MSDEAIDLFANMPLRMEGPGFECAHAELAVPGRFSYIYQTEDSLESFSTTQSPLMFVGHTHLPGYFECNVAKGEVRKCDPRKFQIKEGYRYLVNAGSSGDPRDGTLNASYVIYDAVKKTVDFCFVPFDVDAYKTAAATANVAVRNYFLSVYSGRQVTETETLRDMQVSKESMAKEVRRKPVKISKNSKRRANVNFRKADARRATQRRIEAHSVGGTSTREFKEAAANKKLNMLLMGVGGVVALIITALLIIYFSKEKEQPQVAEVEIVEDKSQAPHMSEEEVLKKALRNISGDNEVSPQINEVSSLQKSENIFETREIPLDKSVETSRTYENISDFDTQKAGWLIHSSIPKKIIFRSEEVNQELSEKAQFRTYDFLHTNSANSKNQGKFRVYSPKFLLNKKRFLHFQKNFQGDSIRLLLLEDGANEASLVPYNEDKNPNSIFDLSEFDKSYYRLLIDGNKVQGDDYLQIDNLGVSSSSSSSLVRKNSSAETSAGRDFVLSLVRGSPSDAIKDMESLRNDLFGVNANILGNQISELNKLYSEAFSFLKSKAGQKVDIKLAGMDEALNLKLKLGKNKNTFDVVIDGNNYTFSAFELHPKELFELSSAKGALVESLKKYSSVNDFLESEDFSAYKLYKKFNPFVYADQLHFKSQKLNKSVQIIINPDLNAAKFKGNDESKLVIQFPYSLRVNRIDVNGLDFDKLLGLKNRGESVWNGVGDQNTFYVDAFNSYLMGKDASEFATINGTQLSPKFLLNLNESFDTNKDFKLVFDNPLQLDYVRMLFWSSVGLDKTIYLTVRHLKEGNVNRKTTFQGVLRPYKGLNYITMALPAKKLQSMDFEFKTDDLLEIRSLKLIQTK